MKMKSQVFAMALVNCRIVSFVLAIFDKEPLSFTTAEPKQAKSYG